MSDKELFKECVSKLNKYGIMMSGSMIYSDNGDTAEFNIDGYNLAFNMMRLGKLIENKVDFS